MSKCVEEKSINSFLIPICDAGDLSRQGEDDVEVFHWQQIVGACGHPVARGRTLTFGTVPVFAGVVGDVLMIAFATCRHMPAERLSSAGLN